MWLACMRIGREQCSLQGVSLHIPIEGNVGMRIGSSNQEYVICSQAAGTY